MSDDTNKDELAYVKRVCPDLSEEDHLAAAARIVPYFRAIPVMVDHLPKFHRRPDAMSDETVHDAMLEMGEQADPIREALRGMLAEFGDQHYHTCPADNDSGPCDCFAGHLVIESMRRLKAEG